MFEKSMSKLYTSELLKTLHGSVRWFVVTTTSGVIGQFLVIFQTFLFAKLITGIPIHIHDELVIMRAWWWLGMVIVMRGACRYIMEWSGVHLAVKLTTNLRRTLLNHLTQMDLTGIRHEKVGEWIQTIYTDIENAASFLRQTLPQMFIAMISPCIILIVVSWVDWISGVTLLITAPLIVFFMILLGRMAKLRTIRRWEAMRQLGGHFYDLVRGLTTLKWFNRSRAQVGVVAKVSEAYRDTTMDTLKIAFLSSFAMELFSTLGTAMVAVGVGLRLSSGHLPFVDALAIIILAGEFYLPLRTLGNQFHASMEGRVALRHIDSLLKTTSPWSTVPLTQAPLESMSVQGIRNSIRHEAHLPILRVESVTYTYPGSTVPALDNVSLSVHAGDRVAIIGPSGAGKSTLLSLVLGSIRPQTGSVYVHGKPLSDAITAAWRHDVAYVGQHPHIFSGSILDNLKLARPTATIPEIQQVAKKTGVAEFVQHLAEGYETKIGSGGVPLSSGQIQRIALARALLKSCSVWVLDEPTAHLDVESERWFLEVLRHLHLSQTVLIITHRRSTVEQMNKVLLMKNGRVTTVDSPKNGGFDSQWYEAQGYSYETMDGK